MRRSSLVCVAWAIVAGCGQVAAPTPAAPAATQDVVTPTATTLAPAPSSAGTLHLLVLGDSIAAGDESIASASYGVPYAAGIEALTGRPVDLEILADPGETSASLADRLWNGTTIRERIVAADIIVITVGGNDGDPFASYPAGTCAAIKPGADCLTAYAPDLEANLDAILTEIEALRAGQPAVVRVTSPDYNALIGLKPSPDLPTFPADLGLTLYRQVADAETAAACAVAKRHDAACVDFLHAFNGADGTTDAAPYLAADHLHPSIAGRDLIAKLLLQLGLEPG